MAFDRPSHQWICAVTETWNSAEVSSAPDGLGPKKPIRLTGAEFLGPPISATKRSRQGGTRRGYLKRLRGARPTGRSPKLKRHRFRPCSGTIKVRTSHRPPPTPRRRARA
eukprot:15570949-Heterocapsa_arctica.AAC.1